MIMKIIAIKEDSSRLIFFLEEYKWETEFLFQIHRQAKLTIKIHEGKYENKQA